MPAVSSAELQERLRRLIGLWIASIPDGWSGSPADAAEALADLNRNHRVYAPIPRRNSVVRVLEQHEPLIRGHGFTFTTSRTAAGRVVTVMPAGRTPDPPLPRNRVGFPCRKCGKPCDAIRSAADPDGSVRRARQCTGCGRRFPTREQESATPVMSIDRIVETVRDSLERQFTNTEPSSN
jgi:hypothetical protein